MLVKKERTLDHDAELHFASWLSDEASDFQKQRFTRTQLTDWLDATGLTSVYRFNQQLPIVESPPPEKPLDTKERNTLLTIIRVLCEEAKLDYTMTSKTADLIQSTAAKLGISIGSTSIRDHLKKIPNALASRTQ